MARRLAFLLSGLLSLSAHAALVPADLTQQVRFPVEKYTLKNGLTVLLHEDHSAPIISFNQWYRVGSRHEKPGRTGLAHFFEHLMFKGTKKYGKGAFEQIVQSNGGTFNAFTSQDYTGYYMNFPSGKLELAIDLESQRMQNLLFDPAEIQSEREVVKEERRKRVENSVFGYLNEALLGTVFKVHPYRWPVIGSMKDLNAANLDDLKNFYRVYYAPNNAVLVIAGDFKSSEAKSLIEKYYGAIPRQEIPAVEAQPEPEQASPRATTLSKNVQNATFAVAYKGVPSGTDEAYALDLLSTILGSGQSSRLYRLLVYQTQMASNVGVWNMTPVDPGVFQVYVTMKPGQNTEKAIELAYAEIFKFRSKPVSDVELEKAKNQAMTAWVNELKTVSGKANSLASNEIVYGDYTRLFQDLERYNAVTKEQIQAAAAKYLLPQRRSVIRVLPKTAMATTSAAPEAAPQGE